MRYLVGWAICALGGMWIWSVFTAPPIGADAEVEAAANMILAIPGLLAVGFGLLVARK